MRQRNNKQYTKSEQQIKDRIMNIKKLIHLGIMVCCVLFARGVCMAQEKPAVTPSVQEDVTISVAEIMLKNQMADFKYNEESADGIWQALIHDLKTGESISDATILKAANYKFGYVHSEKQLLALTTELLKYTSERPLLRNQLESWRLEYLYEQVIAHPFVKSTQSQAFIEESERYLKESQELSWKLDKIRITATSNLAHIALYSGDYKKADPLFIEVFSYPWWKLRDVDSIQYFIDLYIEAGKSLIRIRQGDVKALQRLKFETATVDILGPLRDQAIADAKKKDAEKNGAGNEKQKK